MTATVGSRTEDQVTGPGLRWGSWLMILAAAGFVGYATVFFVRNFTSGFLEIGIGPNEVDVDREAIRQFSPSLLHYIGHLHIALAGFIAATGVAVLFLVVFGVRRGYLWAWVGSVVAPVLALAVSLPTHYPNHLDTLGHLGPVYLVVLVFVAGAVLTLPPLLAARRARSSAPG